MTGVSAMLSGFILSVAGMLGGPQTTFEDPAGVWSVTKNWDMSERFATFEAQSMKVPQICSDSPDSNVFFPPVVLGAHEIQIDNRIIRFGDMGFKSLRSFYGSPTLSCKEFIGAKNVRWRVAAFSHFYARIRYFPAVSSHTSGYNLLAETLNVAGAGATIILCFFTYFVFIGRVTLGLTLSVSASCLLTFFYFAMGSAESFGVSLDPLIVHKVANLGLWIGTPLLFNALRIEGLFTKVIFRTYMAIMSLGLFFVLVADSGDLIQFGAFLAFIVTVPSVVFLLFQLCRNWQEFKSDGRKILQFFSLVSWGVTGLNDMGFVLGQIRTAPVYHMGFTGAIIFLASSVNKRIAETYRERDFLRTNLEAEVERKTKELTHKTIELEGTMLELKRTQAELVQSAKLVSLGTLAAGLAHEINNSLNYVNGALTPLEKVLGQTLVEPQKTKVMALIDVMKQGLSLTLNVIKSLRTYTGLNQAKFNDVNIKSIADATLTILRNRIREKIEVSCFVPEDLSVYGSVVGLNQIFMNLISNALDAMPNGGILSIVASQEGDRVSIRISDTGVGIDAEVQKRIFEPFFTTKDVGKGSGLGLHIVKEELRRHTGEISVESEVNKGTSFLISVPIKSVKVDSQGSDRGAA